MIQSAWQLLKDVRGITMEILNSIPEELTDVVPEGFNNSVRWNAGHILLDQYLWFYHKINDEMPLNEFSAFFGYGTSPKDWKDLDSIPSMETIKQLMEEQPSLLINTFENRFEEKLLSPSEHGITTIGDVIARTLYHEGMHTGTLIAMKRKLLSNIQ
ncbi:DinB family protein [Neobacillus terrae]|uniref:DinB family protein n=1 Tax=Neobacillus terrae TaxID=3034837 RepID=UPI00140DA7D1|nr:DinB family protein [Neobacillus terrae]NHM32998.1 DinB family protein [Neobacillus terrae]